MSTESPVSAPATAAAVSTDAAARQRERIDGLLSRAPARGSGVLRSADGETLGYEVGASFLPVAKAGLDSAPPLAAVMVTHYLVDSPASASASALASPPARALRPVCFAFNGGPGAASMWLQFGALGPKRVVVPDDGSAAAAPFSVVDNPLSWLAHFDLVFVDPPHTGWSAAVDGDERKRLLSVDGDVEALAAVVRLWLTRHRRWGAPVFLAGESYGTTRVAAMADALQADGVQVDGVILVSCAMSLQTLVFAPGNHLPHALLLPALAGVSQYHGLLKGTLAASPQAARAAAEAFVGDDYLGALHAGARLAPARRTRVARRIAELTGLSRTLIEQRDLRIDDQDYFFEALRSRGRIVGRLDARATAPMAARRTREWEFDPGIEAIAPAYASAGLAWYADTLGLTIDARYALLSMDVHKQWDWNRGDARGNGYTDTTPDLARALRRNPLMKVLVASGLYDLGTPYSASDWTLAQLDVPADVRTRITHHTYDAGHMMYTREADLRRLKRDVEVWLAAPAGGAA
ncbi:MAG: peptidase S10 [Rubrivivax sp.]